MADYKPAPEIDVPEKCCEAIIRNSSGGITKKDLDAFFTKFPGIYKFQNTELPAQFEKFMKKNPNEK